MSNKILSVGKRFRKGVLENKPLQVVGTINAYQALMAQKIGHKALYLSGSGIATASHGLPDLGITNLTDVAGDTRRICRRVDIPLLVDVDTGFGNALCIKRTIEELEFSGAAAVHIEDQCVEKRCGHLPGKEIVSTEEMVDRIRAACKGRKDNDFVIMARTDAFAKEGLEKTIERCKYYVDAGADMLFPEALTSLEQYSKLHEAVNGVPILANMTEFGKTELFTRDQLAKAGVSLILYPLSAHRAMCKASETVYKTILSEGTQKSCLEMMQTRDELYKYLDYQSYEKEIDAIINSRKHKE